MPWPSFRPHPLPTLTAQRPCSPYNDSNNDLCDRWIIHNLFWTVLTMHRVFMISYIEVSRREKQRGSGVPIKEQHLNCSKYERCRSQWPRVLRRWSAAARLLRLWVRIPPEEWMSVCCVMFCLCDELITRQEESYRLWCVVVCDLDTSWMGRTWPTGGLLRQKKKRAMNITDTSPVLGTEHFA